MRTTTIAAAILATGLSAGTALAEEKTDFRIAWSIYVGWMPWGYLADSGIVEKWAEKYGINVEIMQINDYVESINQYTAGAFRRRLGDHMDTLSIPAGGGVDTTALIVGDYSNGNDAVILKGPGALADLAVRPVNLVELSVSHYLLARGLDGVGLGEADLGGVVNTSDADMVAAFATPDVEAVVTWNPLVSEILATNPDATNVFDSSRNPRRDPRPDGRQYRDAGRQPRLRPGPGRRLVRGDGADGRRDEAALTAMAEASGTDLEGYRGQLAATAMFFDPADAVAQAESADLPATMTSVAEFLFDKGILGVGAPPADFVGVAYPGGSTTGDPDNVMFRFNSSFMQMAADGAL